MYYKKLWTGKTRYGKMFKTKKLELKNKNKKGKPDENRGRKARSLQEHEDTFRIKVTNKCVKKVVRLQLFP